MHRVTTLPGLGFWLYFYHVNHIHGPSYHVTIMPITCQSSITYIIYHVYIMSVYTCALSYYFFIHVSIYLFIYM